MQSTSFFEYDRGFGRRNFHFGPRSMSEGNSVSQWIQQLKTGNDEAAGQLWERYYKQLVGLAERRLGSSSRRVMDSDDVVVEAFAAFVKNATAGRFPDLNDRDDLWALLITITNNKALDQIRFLHRQKRGPNTRGDSVFGDPAMPPAASPEATPAEAAELTEFMSEFVSTLEEKHRDVFLMKLEGYTNVEIANKLPPSLATVERYLRAIRDKLNTHLTDNS